MIALVIILSVVSIIATIFIIDDDRLRKKIESLEIENRSLKAYRSPIVVPKITERHCDICDLAAQVEVDDVELYHMDSTVYHNILAMRLGNQLKDFMDISEFDAYNPGYPHPVKMLVATIKIIKPEEKKDDRPQKV